MTTNTPKPTPKTKAKAPTLTTRVTSLERRVDQQHPIVRHQLDTLQQQVDQLHADVQNAKRETTFALYIAVCGAAMMLVLYVAWVVS